MDPQSVLQKLEEAARILLAPPSQVTNDQRHQAEQIFLEFRKFSYPYETCRFILEHSRNDYAQFQAAATIKTCIVREWATLPPDQVEQLRMFLLQYVTSHVSLTSYVREEIFQTLAVIVKRGILESDSIAKDKIFNEVTQLISTGDLTMQLIACSLLTALLSEFSSNTKTTGAGFTWEFHIRCKRHFENSHLLQAMVFTLQVLNELARCDTPFNRSQLPVIMRFLSIAEQILNWEFLPTRPLTRRHMVPFTLITQPSFRPSESWRETILNPELLNLFFNLYTKVHYNSELSHHALQSLGQLASLNGSMFNQEEQRLQYLTHFVSGFVKALKSLELKDYDAIGLSSVFENLLRWFSVETFAKLPATVIDPFIQWMTRLTCDFISAAALAEQAPTDDNVYNEALEKMLFSWTSLINDAEDHFGRGHFKKHATQIFNTYVQCHISQNEGSSGDVKVDEYEYEEEDEPDRLKFSEVLTSIGVIGREVTEHALPTLSRVIDERSERLKVNLEMLSQRIKTGGSIHDSSINMTQLNNTYEDLHWLILIATSVLTDEAKGETSLIPTHVMKYSMSQANHINAQHTLNLVTKPEISTGASTQTNNVDCVIRLLSSILRLFYIQTLAVENRLGDSLSPQLDSTCMFCMRRFTEAYLVPCEDNYAEMSVTLQSVLGEDTEGAACFINLLINKIRVNLSVWNSEPDVVKESLETLVTLVSRTKRCKAVIKCNIFWEFVGAVSDGYFPFNVLPASAKRLLYQAIVYAGSPMVDQRKDYWDKMVCKPIAEFSEYVSNEAVFRKTKDQSEVRQNIIHGLETLIGCCQATRLENQTEVFNIVEPCLQATIRILDICHMYEQLVQLCLEVYCEVVSSMICCLDSSPSERLYEKCLSAIHMYAKYHSGTRQFDPEETEEDKFRDILLILDLLVNLMSKDLVDFGLSDTGDAMSISATEVVLFGLTVIVPIMDISLLQFPSLCSQYYKLLAFISELRPDKIIELPAHLLTIILSSVHLSLTKFGSDVAKSGFEFLTELAMYVAQKQHLEAAAKAELDSFLEPILHIVLFESFDVDLLDTISGCLYYLILIYPDKFKVLETSILEQQKHHSHYQLLCQSLQALTPPTMISKGVQRAEKIKFMSNMNKFLLDVKGFLCVL